MINAAYYDKPLIFTSTLSMGESRLEFTKVVSDTVLDMINAVYYDKPVIFIVSTFEFIKVVSDTVLDVINAVYYDKPLFCVKLATNN